MLESPAESIFCNGSRCRPELSPQKIQNGDRACSYHCTLYLFMTFYVLGNFAILVFGFKTHCLRKLSRESRFFILYYTVCQFFFIQRIFLPVDFPPLCGFVQDRRFKSRNPRESCSTDFHFGQVHKYDVLFEKKSSPESRSASVQFVSKFSLQLHANNIF